MNQINFLILFQMGNRSHLEEDVVISVDPSHWADSENKVTEKDKPYGCIRCDKKFVTKRELARHSSVHTGHRPHTCETCGKSFARLDKLKRHLLIHLRKDKTTPSSSIECKECNAHFSLKQKLQSHLLKHHSAANSYQCSHCFMPFSLKNKLIKHINQVHVK